MENDVKNLVAILNYNGSEDTLACIDSFYKYEEKNKFCVVIWDNFSTKEERERLRNGIIDRKYECYFCTDDEYDCVDIALYDLILVYSKKNIGFARGNNRIIRGREDRFKYFILLNNDTEFTESTTSNLIDYMDKKQEVSVVTSVIYYYCDTQKVWNAGGKVFWGTRRYYTEDFVKSKLEHGQRVQTVDFVTGCYLVIRPELVKNEGLFSEKFFFGEEDYEFCLRMKKKKKILQVLLNEKMYHKVGTSIKRDVPLEEMYRRAFIHHLNRFINMKTFYGKVHWNLWRMMSSLYIQKMMMTSYRLSFDKSRKYIQVLNKCAKNREDVDREFFLSVMKGEVV